MTQIIKPYAMLDDLKQALDTASKLSRVYNTPLKVMKATRGDLRFLVVDEDFYLEEDTTCNDSSGTSFGPICNESTPINVLDLLPASKGGPDLPVAIRAVVDTIRDMVEGKPQISYEPSAADENWSYREMGEWEFDPEEWE